MSTSLDIPSSSGIVIVDNSSNNENLLTTVQVQSHEHHHHLPIHHIQPTTTNEVVTLSASEEYANIAASVIDTTQNTATLPSGVINFTTNDVLNNTQIFKFVSDDNTTTTILDQSASVVSEDQLQNYTGRLNPGSKVHVISNIPFNPNKQQQQQHGGGQQAINLVSNGKNISANVNFVNAYITKNALNAGKIVNIPMKATTNSNQMQQQIKTSSVGGNQLIQKVSVPRNVQFVTRPNTMGHGGTTGNIIMSRGSAGQTSTVIQGKGGTTTHQQILMPQSPNIKTAMTHNTVKNKTQLQSVKIFPGGQNKGAAASSSGLSGMKTIISNQTQKLTTVKTSPNAVGQQNKYIKQFHSANSATTSTLAPSPYNTTHQTQQQKNNSHLSQQQQSNLIYSPGHNNNNNNNNNNNTSANNNNNTGSSATGKVHTVHYPRSANSINNVLIQGGKMITKGTKYVVQNPTQTIVLPSSNSSNIMSVSTGNGSGGGITNMQQLKISTSLSQSFGAAHGVGGGGGTIKYVNAQGNVIQPPTKVRAIFQQATSPQLLPPQLYSTDGTSLHTNDIVSSSQLSNSAGVVAAGAAASSSSSMEDMIVNGTIMTDEMSARILQSLSQQKIVCSNNRQYSVQQHHQPQQQSTTHKIYQSTNLSPQKMFLASTDSGHFSTPPQHHSREDRNERYFKVSSCDLSSPATTFIDNIPLPSSTRGDHLSAATLKHNAEDDDELIGEEIRPAPMNLSDSGKIHLLQVVVQDHTYAAVVPEQPKKSQAFSENVVATLNSSNIQSAGLNYNYKPTNNDDDANSVISTGSRNGQNPLDNDLGEETETAPEAEGEDDSITRCICDLTHDDGYMICCDKCSAWQHVDCMGIDRQNIPEEYKCELCQPRPIDKQRARALQMQKRKEQQSLILLNSQQILPGESSQATTSILSQPNAPHKTNLPVGKKHNKTLKKKELANALAQQKREKKLAARVNGKRRETKKPSKRKSKLNAEPQNEKAASLRLWIENYEQAITNHYSPELRARLHALGKHNQMTKDMFPLNTRNLNNLEPKCTTVPHAGGKILISTLDMTPSVPIIEIRGKYMLSNQFRQQQAVSSNTTSVRNHQYNRKPGPFIFFYRLPNDGPEVCIDTRTYGNEARFVRRSCRPNSEVLHNIEKGAIHLYIVSLTNVIGGSEITIKHEPHDLAAISRGTVIAPTSTVCACGFPKDCVFAAAVTTPTSAPPSHKASKKMNGHFPLDGSIPVPPYKRSKSLNTRGRSTSSSGDSNASMLSPNLSSSSIPSLSLSSLPAIHQTCAVMPSPLPDQNPFMQLGPPPVPQQQMIQSPLPLLPPLPPPVLLPPVFQQADIRLATPPPLFPTTISTMVIQEQMAQHNPPIIVHTAPAPVLEVKCESAIAASVPPPMLYPLSPPPAAVIVVPQQQQQQPQQQPSIIDENTNSTPISTVTTPMASPVSISNLSPVKNYPVNKKTSTTPCKVRNMSFSEEIQTPLPPPALQAIVTTPTPTATAAAEELNCPLNSIKSVTTAMAAANPTAAVKDKDSPKLTREERKIEAIMKAFEKMEKNQERKQQLKQNKTSTPMMKRRNSSPASPKRVKDEDEKSYNPRKKKRKGSKSYQHANQKKTRRRSRMNSGDSDLLSSEESTSLLSPPLPITTTPSSYCNSSEDVKPPPQLYKDYDMQSQQPENAVNSAAGLLLALAHTHSDEMIDMNAPSMQQLMSHQHHQIIENNNMISVQPSAPLVSSACLLVEAAVAPLEQNQNSTNETEVKYSTTLKTKTKKSIMNEWLNQAESICHQTTTQHKQDINFNSPVKSLDNLVEAAVTMCNYNSSQVTQCGLSPYTAMQEEPENLSMVAKKVEEFIIQNDMKILSPAENNDEDIKWLQPPINAQYSNVTESTTGVAIPFTTPPGAASSGGSGSAAKKRWLRQAISEECGDEIASHSNGYSTPLKKRRVARQCSELTPEEITHSNMYNSVYSNEIMQIKTSPVASPNEEHKIIVVTPVKKEEFKEEQQHDVIKMEEIKVEEETMVEQEDEIDIVSSPSPGNQIILEDNLVKIEPEDTEKDEKIDVEDVAIALPPPATEEEQGDEGCIMENVSIEKSEESDELNESFNSEASSSIILESNVKVEEEYNQEVPIDNIPEIIEHISDDQTMITTTATHDIDDGIVEYKITEINEDQDGVEMTETVLMSLNDSDEHHIPVFHCSLTENTEVVGITDEQNEDEQKEMEVDEAYIEEKIETEVDIKLEGKQDGDPIINDAEIFEAECKSEKEEFVETEKLLPILETEEKLTNSEVLIKTEQNPVNNHDTKDIDFIKIEKEEINGVPINEETFEEQAIPVETKPETIKASPLDDIAIKEDHPLPSSTSEYNDEIADIQKRLQSFHSENILILKSRNKKKTQKIQQQQSTKNSKPPVKLNFDLSVREADQTVSVKLSEKIDDATINNVVVKKCPDEDELKTEATEIKLSKCSSPDKEVVNNQNDVAVAVTPVVVKEERHTRWDKPDEHPRFDVITAVPAQSTVYPYFSTNPATLYTVPTVAPVPLANAPTAPPTIHIPPNTPASHMQYLNAFYNFSAEDPAKPKYPGFSLLSASSPMDLPGTIVTPNKSYSTLLDTQQPTSQYYCSSTKSLMSSFLNKSYSSDSILQNVNTTANASSTSGPKVLTRTQSADPRLNPNLNVPEPPAAPKRKLSINEYRKRKQQSTDSSFSEKSSSRSLSSLTGECALNGSYKENFHELSNDKEKDVLFSPAPTELEKQQEILSERLKSFKSLHALTGSNAVSKTSDENSLYLTSSSSLKDKDSFELSISRSNRLSTGSSCSSSSFSSSNSDNPSSSSSSPTKLLPDST